MTQESIEIDCKLFNELTNFQSQLNPLNHDERFHFALNNIEIIKHHIENSKNCLVSVMDSTTAGGTHQVKMMFCIKENTVFIEIPNVKTKLSIDSVKGGEFPTILHAIEIITVVYKKLNKEFPQIKFGLASNNYLDTTQSILEIEHIQPVLIPLTIDPDYTNAIIFHTQVRKINPEKLALSWYELYKSDPNILDTPIRHTILLMPLSDSASNPSFESDQPKLKNIVNVAYLKKEMAENKTRFRTLYLGRISRWENFELNQSNFNPEIAFIENNKHLTVTI